MTSLPTPLCNVHSQSLYKPIRHSVSCLTDGVQSSPRIRKRSSSSLRIKSRNFVISGQNVDGAGGSSILLRVEAPLLLLARLGGLLCFITSLSGRSPRTLYIFLGPLLALRLGLPREFDRVGASGGGIDLGPFAPLGPRAEAVSVDGLGLFLTPASSSCPPNVGEMGEDNGADSPFLPRTLVLLGGVVRLPLL